MHQRGIRIGRVRPHPRPVGDQCPWVLRAVAVVLVRNDAERFPPDGDWCARVFSRWTLDSAGFYTSVSNAPLEALSTVPGSFIEPVAR